MKRASLQILSSGGTILIVQSFFNYCQKNIDGIIFEQLNADTLQNSRQKLEKRFHGCSTIPGTRSYHLFEPIGNGEISFQYVAADKDYAGKTSFFGLQPNYTTIQPMEFAAYKYNGQWWIGMVLSMSEEHQDAEIKFMKPAGPSTSFSWPVFEDICNKFIKKLKRLPFGNRLTDFVQIFFVDCYF